MIDSEMVQNAIFDTETDRFVTAAWPDKKLDKILRLWKANHPDLNMSRFEYRPRRYDLKPEDSLAILIIDKETNRISCYFHWSNRGYARGWEIAKYYFVKYQPPLGLDITDILDRNSNQEWDGKGEIVQDW